MIALAVLAIVIVATLGVGVILRTRAGKIRASSPKGAGQEHPVDPALAAVGVGGGVPVILHFSAPWCGPCASVRRVIARVLGDTSGEALDVELDLDENPLPARQLGVMSLPTTFVFDTAGRERYRVSGVPEAADLRAALASL
ncbi:thioredoxin family protein [Rhodococcus sp. NPDC058639]|uniref:thioredoxin family protein n=1 Tax=Rhodococcus sp. NPDC058639 TaxID=3346570 RepID=UPI00364E3292